MCPTLELRACGTRTIEAQQFVTHLGTVDVRHRIGVSLAVGGPQIPPDNLGVPLLAGHFEELRPQPCQA